MNISSIKDAFDRAAKKQKLSSSKTQELLDKVRQEIDSALLEMQQSSDHKTVFRDLKAKLLDIKPTNQLEASQKDLQIALTKYAKLLDKNFNPDISKAYRHVDFDPATINQIIAAHFYRQGLFDLGDRFALESGIEPSAAASLKPSFLELYRVIGAMQSGDLVPALAWAAANRDRLSKNGSSLELKLHRLQFVEILKQGSRSEALAYARKHLAPFAPAHKAEIQKLMACILWAGRLDQSPYGSEEFLSLATVVDELIREFCGALGQSPESPLMAAVMAGSQGLPTLLKLASVMAVTKREEWQTMRQLPVPVDLGREFQFHSIFVCPVLREQGSDENPPMLMPCGHVLSKQSIVKLSKSSSRPFKCPYCPLEANVSQCRQLHF